MEEEKEMVAWEVGMGGSSSRTKRQRRVSFSDTKTVYFIPRDDDFGSSPDCPPTEASSNPPATTTTSSPTASHAAERSVMAASDMDTSDISDGTEEEAGAPVFLWHISYDDKSDTIVGDDTTPDAKTLSRHLSEALNTNSDNSLLSKDESISTEKCCRSSFSLNSNCASLDTKMSLTEFTSPISPSESEQITRHQDVDPSDMSILNEFSCCSKPGTMNLVSIWDSINLKSCDESDGNQKENSSPKGQKLSNLVNVPEKAFNSCTLTRHAKKGHRLSHAKGKENMPFPKDQKLNEPVKSDCSNIKPFCNTRTKPLSCPKEFAGKSSSLSDKICNLNTKGKFVNNGSEASFAEETTIAVPSLSDMLANDPESVKPSPTNSNTVPNLRSAKITDDGNSYSPSICRKLWKEDITILAPRITDIIAADTLSFCLTPLVSPSKVELERKKTSGYELLHNESNDKSIKSVFSDNNTENDEVNDVMSSIDKMKGVQFLSSSNAGKFLPEIIGKRPSNILNSTEKGRSELLASDCLKPTVTDHNAQGSDSEAFVEKACKKVNKEDRDSKTSSLRNNVTQCNRQLIVEASFLQPRLSCTSSSVSKSQTLAGSLWQGLRKTLDGTYIQGSPLNKRDNIGGKHTIVNEAVMPEEILGNDHKYHPLLQNCGNEGRTEDVSLELLSSNSQAKHGKLLKSAENIESVAVLQKSSRPLNCMENAHISVDEILKLLTEKGSVVSEKLQLADWDGVFPAISTKPQTMQEHLIFSCVSRCQIETLLDSMEQLQKHINSLQQENVGLRASISKFKSCDFSSFKRMKDEGSLDLQHFYEWNYRLGVKHWQIYLDAHIIKMQTGLEDCKPFLMDSANNVKSWMPKLVILHEDAHRFLNRLSFLDASSNLEGKTATQMVDLQSQICQAKDKLMKSSQKLLAAKERLCMLKHKIFHGVRFGKKLDVGEEEDVNIDIIKSDASDVIMKIHILEESQLMKLKTARCLAQKRFIELNCFDLVAQRFEYTGNGLDAEVYTSFIINRLNIETNFPFMNATPAFENVVSHLSNKDIIRLNIVPVFIQKTSRLLGCLTDIIFELKECQRAFRCSARFLFPVAGDELLLTFVDMYSSINIEVKCAMDGIKRGVYPRDLLPFNIEVRYGDGCCKGAITVSALQAKISSVKQGFDRIKRICACVYDYIQSNSNEVHIKTFCK